MAERERHTEYYEQVKLSEPVLEALMDEAQRREVSRSQVLREAVMEYLGFRGEGSKEPSRRWAADRNWGRK